MTTAVLTPRALTWRFLSAQRWRMLAAVGAGVLTILSSVALLSVSAYLIERASQRPPILSLMVAIVAVRFFGIARGVFRYVDRYVSHDASFRVLGELRADVYRTLIPLAPGGLSDLGRGELLARVAADVDTMQEWFVRGFAPVCISVVTVLVVAAGTAVILPPAGLALVVALALAALTMIGATGSRGAAAQNEIALRGDVTSATVEFLQGLPDLAALGAAHDLASRIEETEGARAHLTAERARRLAISIGIQTALPGLLAALLGAIALAHLGDGLNSLQVGVLVFAGMAAVECIFAVPGAVDAWERGRAAAIRLAELPNRSAPDTAKDRAYLAGPASLLAIEKVAFRYGEASPPVLERLSLRVAAGEHVVIVGGSGAGKTTLASLLLRFRTPAAGAIRLDGIDIATLDEPSVRRNLGAATQHAHLFAGSIRENILLARPDASEGELRAVVAQARLSEWIARLPQGWDTQVGERGVSVSGGQQRRIALARALLADFTFLIADEPTEGLDTPTARAVMETLFSATASRGLIVITHRPDLCATADAVYELRDGKLYPAAGLDWRITA